MKWMQSGIQQKCGVRVEILPIAIFLHFITLKPHDGRHYYFILKKKRWTQHKSFYCGIDMTWLSTTEPSGYGLTKNNTRISKGGLKFNASIILAFDVIKNITQRFPAQQDPIEATKEGIAEIEYVILIR